MTYYINSNGTLPLNNDGNPVLLDAFQITGRCCCGHPCTGPNNEFNSFCCEIVQEYNLQVVNPIFLYGTNYLFRFVEPIKISTNSSEIQHFGIGKGELYNINSEVWESPDWFYGLATLESVQDTPEGCAWFLSLKFGNPERATWDYLWYDLYLKYTLPDLQNKLPIGTYTQVPPDSFSSGGDGVIVIS